MAAQLFHEELESLPLWVFLTGKRPGTKQQDIDLSTPASELAFRLHTEPDSLLHNDRENWTKPRL